MRRIVSTAHGLFVGACGIKSLLFDRAYEKDIISALPELAKLYFPIHAGYCVCSSDAFAILHD